VVATGEREETHGRVVVREAGVLVVNTAIRLRKSAKIRAAFRNKIGVAKTTGRFPLERHERQRTECRVQDVLAEASVRILLRAEPCESAFDDVADFIAKGEILFVPGQRFIRGAGERGCTECECRGGEEMTAVHLDL